MRGLREIEKKYCMTPSPLEKFSNSGHHRKYDGHVNSDVCGDV